MIDFKDFLKATEMNGLLLIAEIQKIMDEAIAVRGTLQEAKNGTSFQHIDKAIALVDDHRELLAKVCDSIRLSTATYPSPTHNSHPDIEIEHPVMIALPDDASEIGITSADNIGIPGTLKIDVRPLP